MKRMVSPMRDVSNKIAFSIHAALSEFRNSVTAGGAGLRWVAPRVDRSHTVATTGVACSSA